jgi:hypothetical protein
MFLQRSSLDEIVNPDRLLLAQPVQPADALLDLHWIPGQIEICEAMAKLKIAALSAAVSQKQSAAPFLELLGNRLPLGRGRGTIDDERFHACDAQRFGQCRLRFQKLREDHRAAVSFRDRQEQFALAFPTRFQR